MRSMLPGMRTILALTAMFAALATPADAHAQGKQVISLPGANPNPTLSAGIRVGDMLFLSGQLGGNDSTIEGQTKASLENIKKVLDAAGTTVDKVVKCTVFLTDVKDFAKMNTAYTAFFTKEPPARSTVVVAALVRPVAKIEIECIASMK
ncbi:MAG: RidA family protein [Gemmatimonadales bacterium]